MSSLANAVDIVYQGVGPSGNGQVTDFGDAHGTQAQRLVGYVTFLGDGTNQVGTVNYVPGTNGAGQLTYTPTTIIGTRCGGNETNNAVGLASIVDSGNNNTTATVTFNQVPTNNKTYKIGLLINP